jgi:hypothetical protein
LTGSTRGGKYPDDFASVGVVVFDHQDEYQSRWKALEWISKKLASNTRRCASGCVSTGVSGSRCDHGGVLGAAHRGAVDWCPDLEGASRRSVCRRTSGIDSSQPCRTRSRRVRMRGEGPTAAEAELLGADDEPSIPEPANPMEAFDGPMVVERPQRRCFGSDRRRTVGGRFWRISHPM